MHCVGDFILFHLAMGMQLRAALTHVGVVLLAPAAQYVIPAGRKPGVLPAAGSEARMKVLRG